VPGLPVVELVQVRLVAAEVPALEQLEEVAVEAEVAWVAVQELEQVVQVSVLKLLLKGYMLFGLFGKAIQMKLLPEPLRPE